MVIDFHVHVGGIQHWRQHMPWVLDLLADFRGNNGLDLTVGGDGEIVPERLLSYLDEVGVDCAVVIAEYFALEWVAEFCSTSPRFIPYANINPHLVAYPAKEVERLVRLGYKGLKFLPTYHHFYPNDNKLYPFYDAAQALELPVIFHIGSSIFPETRLKFGDPIYLDDIARDFPKNNIIMAHSGRGFWYEACFFLSRFHPNVYMDITGLPPRNLLNYFPDFERNADKILYGTDWPAGPGFSYTLDELRKLNLKPENLEKILGGNAARLLRLDDNQKSKGNLVVDNRIKRIS